MSRSCPALLSLGMAVLVLSVDTAFAVEAGRILAAGRSGASILVVDALSGSQSILTASGMLSTPTGVAVAANGDVFIVDGDRFGAGSKIIKFDPVLGIQSLVASGGNLLNPVDIAIESTGNLVIADYTGPSGLGGIMRVNPVTGSQTVLLNNGTLIRDPYGVAIEANGNLVFTGVFVGLHRLDIVSGVASTINPLSQGNRGVEIEADGQIVLPSLTGEIPDRVPTVARIDPVTGAETILSIGGLLGSPAGIALDSQGVIYVSRFDGIVRVDPATGAQELVSSGGLLQDLHGLAFVPSARCPIDVAFEFKPDALNPRSKGHWVTGVLEPEPPVSPADIDVASILLNGSVAVDASAPSSIGDADDDGRPDLSVKFGRAALALTVSEGDSVLVTVRGETGSGCFEATDVIRVIGTHIPDGAAQGGGTVNVRRESAAEAPGRPVAVATPLRAGEASVELALRGALPNPGRCLSVSFTLPGSEPAALAVYDVSGREVSRREVGELGAGRHVVTMGSTLAPGVYLVHLIQGERRLIARAVVVP